MADSPHQPPAKLMTLARKEVERMRHEYVGTEHILLAMLASPEGTARRVLASLGADAERLRKEILNLVPHGIRRSSAREHPFTPRARKCLDAAMEEAQAQGDGAVREGHVLMGLVRDAEGIAAHVLMGMGLSLDEVRRSALAALSAPPRRHAAAKPRKKSPPKRRPKKR